MKSLPSLGSVVRVGGGRGFVIGDRVVTAAHCLPHLPPAHAASYLEERTFENLLGALDAEPTIWAECLFVDPVADIAVLGCPDGQELHEQADAYDAFIAGLQGFEIGKTGKNGWMLSLDKPYRWLPTPLDSSFGSLYSGPTLAGQSGSPILNEDGEATGVVSIGVEDSDGKSESTAVHGPQPTLVSNLPGWMLGTSSQLSAKEEVRS